MIMDDKVRLIDAEALKNYMCSACPNKERCEDTEQVCSAILDVDEQPTIEAVTREQYHDMTERFFDEFVDNGADAVTVAKCMFIGVAFGKLELMLFESEGNKDE